MGIPFEFCKRFLKKAEKTIPLFAGVLPERAKDTWIPAKKGTPYGVVVTKDESHGEMCFSKNSRGDSFNDIYLRKDIIEKDFGGKIEWKFPDSKDDKGKIIKRAKIMTPSINLGYADEKNWNILIDQLVEMMSKFIDAVEGAETLSPQGHTSVDHTPSEEVNEFLPGKAYTERAIAQLRRMQHESPSRDEILNQIEKMALSEKKTLKGNWREITKRNIAIWFEK